MTNQIKILTMVVNVLNIESSLKKVAELVQKKSGSYICVSNVHMCMETFDCPNFAQVVNNADLVIPDGRPLSWAQKLLGHKEAKQVRGQDITNALCQLSAAQGIRIGFYGGSSDNLLNKVIENLNKTYPGVNVAYSYSPPFRPLTDIEDQQVVLDIIQSNVDILFVGIGCPKQERWMAEHKEHLKCVMLGVGAAFDFIAGEKKHAQIWMQKLGLEWLFRLCSEPRRLWKRYLKQNPRFVYYFLQQWLFNKRFE